MENPSRVSVKTSVDNHQKKIELGQHAIWSLSSAKPNFGVEQLRDGSVDTYWQSDGNHPHFINIQFHKRTYVSDVRMHCDILKDETYTPARISVHTGTSFHDLQQVEVIELSEPTGWFSIPLLKEGGKPICTNLIQIAIEGMHQNGKDTHVRQVQVWGPRESCLFPDVFPDFKTRDFYQYDTIR